VLAAILVEYLGNRAPPRPPGQDRLLTRVRRPAAALQVTQQRKRSQVGADPADRTGRSQIILPGRTERT
jgi:hypothetical protein